MWNSIVALVSRLRFAFTRTRVDEDAQQEFATHLELLIDRNIRSGMTPDEARHAARRQFGSPLLVRAEIHEMNSLGWLERLVADARHSLRLLVRAPGFTIVAVLTLALGVGANAAVFSVIDATLIRPLPYADPQRLVAVFETARRATVERRGVSYPNFRDWQAARSFDAMSVVIGTRFTVAVGGVPERLVGELVSGRFFDVLGVRPASGRGFAPQDDAQGALPVVVISHALWRRVFGGDPQIVGRSVRIDDQPWTIVGVMPPGFSGIVADAELWAPIERVASAELVNTRGQRAIDLVLARLAPGVGIEQARTEMDALAARLDTMYPSPAGERGVGITPLRDEFFGPMTPMLLVLLGAVGFVLLIACVNVANLLLSRGSVRQGELAVRRALGARRGRLIVQLLTESAVLSVLGGVAGVLAAIWGVDLLVAMSPVTFPEFVSIGVDLRVLAFTFAVCLAAGLLSGIVPAISATRAEPLAALNATGRDRGASSAMLQRGLITAQIALALVLLVGAGLMLRTMERLSTFDPGFRPEGLVTLRLTVPETSASGEAAPERLEAFSRAVLEQVRALPGVTAASLSSDVPLGTGASATIARLEGDDTPIRVYRHAVSPRHFQTIGAPLLEGRDFTDHDGRTAAEHIVIVSRAMAQRHWKAGDALHKRIRIGDRLYEVVGIVGDVQHRSLLEPDSADPDIFLPMYQVPSRAFAVVARTAADPQPVVAAIRETIAKLDPAVPLFQVETGEQLVSQQTSGLRFGGVLLALFAFVALALTLVGIYGVTAYTVSRQTRQVGIRMALGATPGDVLRLVLSGGVFFIAAGLALGSLAALALTQLLRSLVYGVSVTDPVTFAAVILLLAFVAVVACLVPAVKATRIDPLVALRAE
jgi:putative ABC transport system permease protein